MPKKKNKKKNERLVYETDPLVRWNLCQKIAGLLYKSDLTLNELNKNFEDILEYTFYKIKK